MESSVLLTPVIEASATKPMAFWSRKISTMNGMESAMMRTPDAPGDHSGEGGDEHGGDHGDPVDRIRQVGYRLAEFREEFPHVSLLALARLR